MTGQSCVDEQLAETQRLDSSSVSISRMKRAPAQRTAVEVVSRSFAIRAESVDRGNVSMLGWWIDTVAQLGTAKQSAPILSKQCAGGPSLVQPPTAAGASPREPAARSPFP